MRLTTKGRYGLRAVANLASSHTQNDRPISISQISEEEEISPEFLEQIFFKLKKAGIIRSVRGPKGGFLLNLEPGEITVRKILEAVGEPIFPVPCTNPAENCERQAGCCMSPVWHRFYTIMDDFLSEVTLQDIIDREPKGRVAGPLTSA